MWLLQQSDVVFVLTLVLPPIGASLAPSGGVVWSLQQTE